eukprot:1486173-Rhodomonas_salina.5
MGALVARLAFLVSRRGPHWAACIDAPGMVRSDSLVVRAMDCCPFPLPLEFGGKTSRGPDQTHRTRFAFVLSYLVVCIVSHVYGWILSHRQQHMMRNGRNCSG